jgi:nitroimidazol reductase NimA-like FMN-containing flavoprotein (pyridoxamine 5'-phosphate oxidase superfamily)
MRSPENPEKVITDLLSEQLFAILATKSEHYPHMVIVSFIVSKGLKEIVFVTPRQTKKYAHIMKNNQVSLYIDNRNNDMNDLQSLTGLEVFGTAVELKDEETKEYREFYLAKYPDMLDFIGSPTSAFLKIEVSQYELINHFQNVTTIVIRNE